MVSPQDPARHAGSGGRRPYPDLQQWMRHRDIASTMVYLKGIRNRDIQARLNKGSMAAFA
jgi:hypothetical protein